ncbi:MAG: beta-ketoacyl synthase N-terminal-like domain-containing protein [Candidatus Promineifilaceae bacterium]
MNGERVVVTGVGVVSPLALDSAGHFARWLAGESAVTLIEHPLYEENARQLQAPVRAYDRRQTIDSRMLRKLLSPSAGYAVGAAGEALQMAGLTGASDVLEQCGLYVGSLSLEIDPGVFIPPLRASLDKAGNFDISLFARRGMKLIDPLFLVKALPNAGVCGISVQHQILGPNINLTNGPTSGLAALALADGAIRRGEAACALVAGYDTLLGVDSFVEHFIAGRLSTRYDSPAGACRPFDRERDGYVLGEGAACVLLESAGHARRRGAEPLAEILALGQATAVAALRPQNGRDGRGLSQAAGQALRAGGCEPARLGALFMDGLGTAEDDIREAQVAHEVTGGAPVPVTAATPAIGYTGAAGGLFSLVHALLALRAQVIPPLANYRQPDPNCPIHCLAEAGRGSYDRALVWNSDRGVKNLAVLLGRAVS